MSPFKLKRTSFLMPLRVGFDGVRVIFPPSSSTFSFCFLGVDFGLRLLPRFFLVVLGVALGVAIVSNFAMRFISGAIASAMAALNMSLNSAFAITAKCPKAEADF